MNQRMNQRMKERKKEKEIPLKIREPPLKKKDLCDDLKKNLWVRMTTGLEVNKIIVHFGHF